MGTGRRATIGLAVAALAGCTTVDPTARWNELEQLNAEATGQPLRWERTDADAQGIKQQVDESLANGLSRDEAVRIAMLNNRTLQAQFEDVGIAEADFVQAGLYSNPQLDVFIGFPIAAENSAATLAAILSELWTVPARQRIAGMDADAAVRVVAAAAVATAADAELAYDEVLFRREALCLEKHVRGDHKSIVEYLQSRASNNKSTNEELAQAQSVWLNAQIDVAAARRDRNRALDHLGLALGVDPARRDYYLTDRLESTSAQTWSPDDAVRFALAHRLDLTVARIRVAQARQALAFERMQVIKSISLGPGYAGGFGTGDTGGAVLGADVPLFDQNQAQIAKARLHIRQSKKALQAAELRARQEVLDALGEITFLRKQIELQRSKVDCGHLQCAQNRSASRAESAGTETKTATQAGLNVMDVLTMRDTQNDQCRRFNNTQWELRQAEVALRTALWGGATDSQQ